MLDIQEFAKGIKTEHFVGGERVVGVQGFPFPYYNRSSHFGCADMSFIMLASSR